MFNFGGTAVLVSTVVPFYLPINSARGIQFLRVLPDAYCFLRSHPDGCEVFSFTGTSALPRALRRVEPFVE